MSDGTIDGWLMLTNDVVEYLHVGMIIGVEFNVASTINDQLVNDITDYLCDEDTSGCRLIKFTISNISFNNGQMSHPETGQWDFLPHFEFDLTVTKNEIIEESL